MSSPASPQSPLARVLVVEDHPEMGRLMGLVLERARLEATVVPSGEAALARLAAEACDLILLDIALPGMGGLEVCRRLKADPRLQRIPVIFVSGQTSAPYQAAARRLGAVDFIEKPFELLPFLACVMGHLDLRTEGGLEVRKWLPLPAP